MNKTKTLFVGRTSEGFRVWVSLNLRTRAVTEGMRTVDHEVLTGDTYAQLSITGSAVAPRARSISSCGQILDDLAGVVDYRGSAFDDAAVGVLLILWERWHLNDMRAACAHMDLPADRSYEARRDITCPETGYRYGSAWLVAPLPAVVVTTVEAMMTLDAGSVPHYV